MKNECKDELFEKVLDVASRVTGCNRDAILSRCKQKYLADARRMMVGILYSYGYSISHISRLFNFSNHTNARYLLHTHPDYLYYKKYEYQYKTILKQLEL
jgi:hypothetical protein